ncbi:hypothetical protein MTO96_001029 [Rhipicephalus appendiculatus]
MSLDSSSQCVLARLRRSWGRELKPVAPGSARGEAARGVHSHRAASCGCEAESRQDADPNAVVASRYRFAARIAPRLAALCCSWFPTQQWTPPRRRHHVPVAPVSTLARNAYAGGQGEGSLPVVFPFSEYAFHLDAVARGVRRLFGFS